MTFMTFTFNPSALKLHYEIHMSQTINMSYTTNADKQNNVQLS